MDGGSFEVEPGDLTQLHGAVSALADALRSVFELREIFETLVPHVGPPTMAAAMGRVTTAGLRIVEQVTENLSETSTRLEVAAAAYQLTDDRVAPR